MKEQYHWIDLWSAFCWMRETFPFSIINHEEAFKNALLSGEVPTRGKARYLSAYQRIEKNITADTEFLIVVNTMRTNAANFEAVQIERLRFEAWINSNAIEYPEAPTVGNVQPRKRPGPEPGKLRRYDAADRALFPELERLMKDEGLSKTAAAKKLANEGRITGTSTADSKARRLLKLLQEK